MFHAVAIDLVDNVGTEIIPGRLYMCGINELLSVIQKQKPDVIVSMVYHSELDEQEKDWLRTAKTLIHHPIDDSGVVPEDLNNLVNFITAAIVEDNQKVLVQCAAGWNRSGLVVALSLREILSITGAQAVDLVQERRGPGALCNSAFKHYVQSRD